MACREAIANEFAARFHASRGFETIANAYLQEARFCYRRWGAEGKVRQLDRLYPRLAVPEGQRFATADGSPVQHLDVASVVKATQALSSEIELPKLIERLMTIALENAGADRGVLVLPAGDEYLIHAEARTSGDQIEVRMCQEPITGITCPESVVRYVIRTQESCDSRRCLQTQPVLCGRLSARPAIEVDPLPPTHQATAINRDSPPRKRVDLTRVHTGANCGPGTASGTSSDLAGEHAPL